MPLGQTALRKHYEAAVPAEATTIRGLPGVEPKHDHFASVELGVDILETSVQLQIPRESLSGMEEYLSIG